MGASRDGPGLRTVARVRLPRQYCRVRDDCPDRKRRRRNEPHAPLSARAVNLAVRTVGLTETPNAGDYHRNAGADHVLSPEPILGEQPVSKAVDAFDPGPIDVDRRGIRYRGEQRGRAGGSCHRRCLGPGERPAPTPIGRAIRRQTRSRIRSWGHSTTPWGCLPSGAISAQATAEPLDPAVIGGRYSCPAALSGC